MHLDKEFGSGGYRTYFRSGRGTVGVAGEVGRGDVGDGGVSGLFFPRQYLACLSRYILGGGVRRQKKITYRHAHTGGAEIGAA